MRKFTSAPFSVTFDSFETTFDTYSGCIYDQNGMRHGQKVVGMEQNKLRFSLIFIFSTITFCDFKNTFATW